jgi:hypothetical protein
VINILGIDPGKTTGLAVILIDPETKKARIDHAGVSMDLTAIEYKDLLDAADYIIVEDFKVRPGKAKSGSFDWSPMETPKIIGSIQTLAALIGKKVVLQQPTIKPMGYGFANMNYVKGKPGTHFQDAAAHAMYFAVKQKLALPGKLL